MPAQGEITRILQDLNAGKKGAEEELLPLLYNELRALARYFMNDEREGHTLQTTALVHEAYLRMSGGSDVSWENKSHFMRLAARAMRQVLIDHARRKLALKRGSRGQRLPLEMAERIEISDQVDLIALDEALTRLSELDPRLGRVVELRFFGGLSVEETARVLGVSPRTVKGDWTMARAWLKQELDDGPRDE